MNKRQDLVPISVVEKLIDMHYKHLEEVTRVYMDKLEEIVRGITTPVVVRQQESEKMWLSEEEEDADHLSYKAELDALAAIAKEQGFDIGELTLER